MNLCLKNLLFHKWGPRSSPESNPIPSTSASIPELSSPSHLFQPPKPVASEFDLLQTSKQSAPAEYPVSVPTKPTSFRAPQSSTRSKISVKTRGRGVVKNKSTELEFNEVKWERVAFTQSEDVQFTGSTELPNEIGYTLRKLSPSSCH